MDSQKIPKLVNETDEANRAFKHREELAAEIMNQYRRDEKRCNARLETVLHSALQTKEHLVTFEELNGRSLVSVLREKLAPK
jgi:hypothetical protein